MTWLLIAVSVVAIVAALILRANATREREDAGLVDIPVYSDADASATVLVSEKHRLTGKPDHIIKVDGTLIPIERKSRTVSDRGPHDGEVLQLAAYCLLVEEHFGVIVTRGTLQYPNRSIDIPFDEDLRARLLATLSSLNQASELTDVHRSHNHEARCRACGFRASCVEALA